VNESAGRGRVIDKNPHLDVAGLAAVGEVGGGHKGPRFVDDDALGVQAAPGLRFGRTGGRSKLPGAARRRASSSGGSLPRSPRTWWSQRLSPPSPCEVGRRCLSRGRRRSPLENVEDALLGVLEELAHDDEGVAGRADEGLRAGPDEVHARDGTVTPLGDGGPEDGLKQRGVESLQILRYFRNEGLDSMLMRGDDTLAVGLWLSENVEPGSTVRTARLGGMSYGAPELIFWDENGLTDRAHANLDFRRKSGWSQLESGPSARAGRGGGPPRSREMELYRRRGRARAASLRLLPRFPVSPGELRRGPHLGPAPALAGLPYEAIATIFASLRTRP